MSLPTELLIQITDYLSVHDKRTGLMVCHDWYEAFRYGLYREIHIKNIKQLLSLLHSFTIGSIPHNGHLVKRLYLNKQPDQSMLKTQEGILLNQCDLFEQLPLLCPHLEVLDFDPASWNHINYSSHVEKTWSHSMRQLPTLSHSLDTVMPFLNSIGKNLTHMTINSAMFSDTIGVENTFESLLTPVPNLKYLEFQTLDDKDTTTTTTTTTANTHSRQFMNITPGDMETIHQLVPYLQSLKITGNGIRMPINMDQDVFLDKAATLPQFKSIKTLHLNIPDLNVIWLFYVTQKYPYVKDLVLNLNYDKDDHQQDYALLYISLITKCKYIQSLRLGCPDISHWINPSVLKTVERSCIRELAPILSRDVQIKTDQELRVATDYGKHVLTTLEIEQWRFETKLTDTIRLLYQFSKLTCLELRCDSYNDEYRLVDILDACSNLKQLSLEWGTVSTTATYCMDKRQYPLEHLSMTYIAFEDTLFSQFLSTQCPHLTQLSLSKCKQLCVMNNIKTQTLIDIDLPNHQLELVSISGVRLEYSNASLFYHSTAGYVRILELKEEPSTMWYHHVGYKERQRRYPVMDTLDRIDQASIYQYLNTSPSLIRLSQQKWSDALKTDLLFGYISLNCKSIQNLFFDGNAQCT